MAAKAVQISLEQDLLHRIDDDPETREKGRSAFIRTAVELYLRAKDRQKVDEAIARAYGGHAEAMLGEITDLVAAQAWPKD